MQASLFIACLGICTPPRPPKPTKPVPELTKTCFSDSCDETFTYDPEHEEVSYCSEECETEQSARNAGEDLHDRMKEGNVP